MPDYTIKLEQELPGKTEIAGTDEVRIVGGVNGVSYKNKLSDFIGYFADMLYPVGSYYETSDTSFDPNLSWSGVWELEDEGLVHIGAGENYEAGDTGGEADHTLTAAESGTTAHGHTLTPPTYKATGTAVNDHSAAACTRTASVAISNHAASACTRTANVAISNHAAAACTRSSNVVISDHNMSHTHGASSSFANFVMTSAGQVSEEGGGNLSGSGYVYPKIGTMGTFGAIGSTLTSSKSTLSHTVSTQPAFATPALPHTVSTQPTFNTPALPHTVSTQPTFNTPNLTHTVTQPTISSTSSGSVGTSTAEPASSAHNNMQPYIVVNRWHRVA